MWEAWKEEMEMEVCSISLFVQGESLFMVSFLTLIKKYRPPHPEIWMKVAD